MMRSVGKVVATTVLLVAVAACGAEENTRSEAEVPGLSLDEALATAQQHARESLALWGPDASLTPIDDGQALGCSNLSSPPDGTPVHVTATYEIHGMEKGTPGELLDAFGSHWADQGWSESYRHERAIALRKDGYVLNLRLHAKEALILGTPCIAGEPANVPIDDITQ